MVFKIPIKPLKKKKWWQFWKKDLDANQELKKYIDLLQRDYWFPSPDWGNRITKIDKIRNKINSNYHSLNE